MNQYIEMNMSRMLAEDVYAPELRNPKHSGMRRVSLIGRVIAKVGRLVRR